MSARADDDAALRARAEACDLRAVLRRRPRSANAGDTVALHPRAASRRWKRFCADVFVDGAQQSVRGNA